MPAEKVSPFGNTFRSGDSHGRFHWTVETFYRAVEADLIDAVRWELLDGEIIDRGNMNPPHAIFTEAIYEVLRRLLGNQFWVRQEKPITIAVDAEPMPDISVIDPARRGRTDRHPTPDEVKLLIEVADATETKDTEYKAAVYAQAGIADYWVVLVNKRQVNVYRNPEAGAYHAPRELKDGDTVSPLVAPEVLIAVSDLLPPVTGNIADTEPVL